MPRFRYELLLAIACQILGSQPRGTDRLTIESVTQKQLPTSGAQLIIVAGGDWSESAILRLGNTNCDRTEWESPTVLKCKAPPGVGRGLPMEVFDGSKSFSVARAVSYDEPTVERASPARSPCDGNRLIQVSGFNFGVFDSRPKVQIGQTSCVEVEWVSANRVDCVIPPATEEGKVNVLVSIGGQTGVLNQGYQYKAEGTFAPYPMEQPMIVLRKLNLTCEMLGQASGRPLNFIVSFLDLIVNKNTTLKMLQDLKISAADAQAIMIAHSVILDRFDALEIRASLGEKSTSIQQTLPARPNSHPPSQRGSSNNLPAPAPALPPPPAISAQNIPHAPIHQPIQKHELSPPEEISEDDYDSADGDHLISAPNRHGRARDENSWVVVALHHSYFQLAVVVAVGLIAAALMFTIAAFVSPGRRHRPPQYLNLDSHRPFHPDDFPTENFPDENDVETHAPSAIQGGEYFQRFSMTPREAIYSTSTPRPPSLPSDLSRPLSGSNFPRHPPPAQRVKYFSLADRQIRPLKINHKIQRTEPFADRSVRAAKEALHHSPAGAEGEITAGKIPMEIPTLRGAETTIFWDGNRWSLS